MFSIKIHAANDLRVTGETGAPEPQWGEVKVNISKGGICGSDLHYYHNGGFGAVRLREPMILGHEVSGVVAAVGEGVDRLSPGDRVAVNPSMPCDTCAYCRKGLRNHCDDMRFFGSAMRFPHQQGLFRQEITIPERQLVLLNRDTDLSQAACAEPLAVCLHAVSQAGDLKGKKVLVSGCGPIGCLTVMSCVIAGAQEIVATDMYEAPLRIAKEMGATTTINVANDESALAMLTAGKGTQDVVFECSGSPEALDFALAAIRPRGTIVTVGLGGKIPVEVNLIVAKEIEIKGSFRFDQEFYKAVELIDKGVVDLASFITSSVSMSSAQEAFELASQREKAMKVQIDFEAC
ncbi:L-idonate 5-dehydrogenase [Halomonas salipaludis]|uniref:L-idonate 5-dehydrogenase n=1 Tax=Halomonas salipaludis TaxID=2032625 RepID=A0A2A2F0M7_9GAMM|nr:L-idonate 5-dehydrogenase [Halomonas salipaludis]PAU78330.1 L-idonate 5-dehydrogenase [Halomonas salipaludis]